MTNTPKPLTRSEMFDARRNELLEQIAEGSGGGGGGNVVVAHGTITELPTTDPVPITLDKTYAELSAAEYSVVSLEGFGDVYYMPAKGKWEYNHNPSVQYNSSVDLSARVIVTAEGAILVSSN